MSVLNGILNQSKRGSPLIPGGDPLKYSLAAPRPDPLSECGGTSYQYEGLARWSVTGGALAEHLPGRRCIYTASGPILGQNSCCADTRRSHGQSSVRWRRGAVESVVRLVGLQVQETDTLWARSFIDLSSGSQHSLNMDVTVWRE